MVWFMKVRYCSGMRTRVNNLIEKYEMLHDGDTVIVGVSGGADSVCLLFLLCEIKSLKLYDIEIEVIHINHMLRQTAVRDEEFVIDLCNELERRFSISLNCHTKRIDVASLAKESGKSTEEAGREARYEAMRELLGSRKGVIAIAHHANDRAETMLFNLFRGASLKGLSSIQPVNGNIIRPLINMTRDEIESFLEQNGLNYVTDETNLTDDYTRNKIRHHIIDYAEKNIQAGAVKNMSHAADQIAAAEDYLSECTKKAALRCVTKKTVGKVSINIAELKNNHDYIIGRLLYEAVVYVSDRKRDITHEHVRRIKLLLETNGSKRIDLPYHISVKKEYDILTLVSEEAFESENRAEGMKTEGTVNMCVLEAFDLANIPRDTYTKWFDYDKISSVAKVRTRLEGDYLCINKDMNKQSLQDYFVNEKVPLEKRDAEQLLADGNHIMWVIGRRISEYYKVDENTKRVLEVRYE